MEKERLQTMKKEAPATRSVDMNKLKTEIDTQRDEILKHMKTMERCESMIMVFH